MATPNESLLANGLNALQLATKTRTAGLDTAVANAKSRANHTGTQPASTISDFNTAVDARITAAGGSGGTALTIGTVTTLPAGSQATASISNGKLNLGIPQGAAGAAGASGGGTTPTGSDLNFGDLGV